MKPRTHHILLITYLLTCIILAGLLLSSCNRDDETCAEKNPTYLDTPIIGLSGYEHKIFDIYKGNDTLRLKESSTGIIHTYVSTPVSTFYTYYTDPDPDINCKRYDKYENKKVVFYRTDDQSELSVRIVILPRGGTPGFWYFYIHLKRFPFYDGSGRFRLEGDITYKEFVIEGKVYKNVYKFISDTNQDSSFTAYYALYNKTEGVLQIKFEDGNTFSRVP